MSCDDLVEIMAADKDSHFRLLDCGCGSDQGAYVRMDDGLWRVRCFSCGHTSLVGVGSKHGAQVIWNQGGRKCRN